MPWKLELQIERDKLGIIPPVASLCRIQAAQAQTPKGHQLYKDL